MPKPLRVLAAMPVRFASIPTMRMVEAFIRLVASAPMWMPVLAMPL